MEVRRSARIAAAKQARAQEAQETQNPSNLSVKNNHKLLRSRHDVILNVNNETKMPKAFVYQKHDQTFLFINFIVHGLMKYEIHDPKAKEMKEKTSAFLQLTGFFVLIKCILWYFGYLQ
jgi:hypothetical protein